MKKSSFGGKIIEEIILFTFFLTTNLLTMENLKGKLIFLPFLHPHFFSFPLFSFLIAYPNIVLKMIKGYTCFYLKKLGLQDN